MTTLAVALSVVGLLLTLVGAAHLLVSTWRPRATVTQDVGLAGRRGIALAAVLVGLMVIGGADLLVR